MAKAQRLTTSELVRANLSGKRLDLPGLAFEAVLLVALLTSLVVLLTLLGDIVLKGAGVFVRRGTGFLSGGLSTFSAETAGVGQGIVGSLLLMAVVVVVAFPIGIGAAVYLEEYAEDTRFNRFINVNIRNLAGVPAIVYGLLGLTVFVAALAPLSDPQTRGKTLLAGGLTLAVLVLPIVIITAAEALRAVPQTLREAAYGVGATRWQVIRHHVLPYAAPGILTGTVLAISRALGETAPLLLVGAVTGYLSTGGASPFELLGQRYTALPTIIFRWSTLPNASFRELTAAAIIVLLVLTLTANAAAIILRNRYERRW
jgi:phosphate transport system permease protein